MEDEFWWYLVWGVKGVFWYLVCGCGVVDWRRRVFVIVCSSVSWLGARLGGLVLDCCSNRWGGRWDLTFGGLAVCCCYGRRVIACICIVGGLWQWGVGGLSVVGACRR